MLFKPLYGFLKTFDSISRRHLHSVEIYDSLLFLGFLLFGCGIIVKYVHLCHFVFHCFPTNEHIFHSDEYAQYEEHLHRREERYSLSVEILSYHLSRSGEEIKQSAWKAAIAHTPHFECRHESVFYRKPLC